MSVDEVDRELMEGMGNCYHACGEDFEGTVRMVARSRGYTSAEITKRLHEIKIVGDHRGRECTAVRADETYEFRIKFDSESGEIESFRGEDLAS